MSFQGRVVFFGTPDFAKGVLERLIAAGLVLCAVVVQPDKTRGRDRHALSAAPVKEAAMLHGIPVLQPSRCKDEAFLAELEALRADVFLVVAFGQLLPQRLLDMPTLGAFNAHASLLPRWRGPAPINWSILAGDAESGMCIQRMRLKLDSGPLVWQHRVTLDAKEDAETLRATLMPLAAEGFLATLAALEAGTLTETEQDENAATLAPKLTKEQGLIEWARPAAEIDRLVRGLRPWPGVYTLYEGQTLKLHDVSPTDETSSEMPGRVLRVGADGIHVATGEGVLRLDCLQREGKKKMNADAFLCGCRLRAGDRLGL